MIILNSHFLGHLPKPRLKTIQACGAAGKTAFQSFFRISECIWFCCWQKGTCRLSAKVLWSLERAGAIQIPQVYKEESCQNCFVGEMGSNSYHANLIISYSGDLPINPKHGPCARSLYPDVVCGGTAADPPRRGMWWDCIPRAKCSCTSKLSTSSPEVCFSSVLTFVFYFWLVATCLEPWITERIHPSLRSLNPGQAREWVGGTVLPWVSWR